MRKQGLWWKMLRIINLLEISMAACESNQEYSYREAGALYERCDSLEKDDALARNPRTINPQLTQPIFLCKFLRSSREIRQQLLSRPMGLRLICFLTEDLKDPSLCREIRYVRLKEVPQFEPRLQTVHNFALPNQLEPGGEVKIDQLFVSDQRNPVVGSVRPSPDVLFQKGGSEFLSLVSAVDANGVNTDRFPVCIVGRHGFMC